MLDLIADELEDADLANEVSKAKERVAAQRRAQVAAAAAVAPRPAASASSAPSEPAAGAPTPLQPIQWIAGRGLLQKEAKVYLPPGSYLSKDMARHFRWVLKANYMPRSYSKTFSVSDRGTDNSALQMCLEVAWMHYKRQTGQPCPFAFDRELFG